jgi:hypothetical protein
MHKLLEACPCCGGALAITSVECMSCGTSVTGSFRVCDFCRLSDEQATFLRLFVQRRGNLSEMEKALGISYPTVRNKLEEIVRVLHDAGAVDGGVSPASERDAILQQVAEGKLSAAEALDRLAALSAERAADDNGGKLDGAGS